MESIERTADPAADPEMWTRWVFFPKLIESCGTISKKKSELQIVGKGGSVPACKGDVETLTDKCSISPYLVDGEASALWALRTFRFLVLVYSSCSFLYAHANNTRVRVARWSDEANGSATSELQVYLQHSGPGR